MIQTTDPTTTRVLTAAMTWQPLHTLTLGDNVVTFDEHPTDQRYRMYRIGAITDIHTQESDTVGVTTTKADICVPVDHSFLCKKWNKTVVRDAPALELDDAIYWFAQPTAHQTNSLYKRGYLLGAFAGDGSVPGWKNRERDSKNQGSYISSTDEVINETVIRFAADVAPGYELTLKERQYNAASETARMPVAPGASTARIRADLNADYPNDPDFARGWLAGLFDTDGTYPKGKELAYCQTQGPIFEQARDYLDLLGYDWSHDQGKEDEYAGKIRLTPGRETGRVYEHLAEIRPKLDKKRLAFTDNKRIGGHTDVLSIEPTGTKTTHRVTTSTGTLITQGMLSIS